MTATVRPSRTMPGQMKFERVYFLRATAMTGVPNGEFRVKATTRKGGRPTIRRSGKPLSDAERCRRWRAKKKAQLKARQEVERRSKRIELNGELGILSLAIADVTETALASNSVDIVLTDPPYAERDLPLYGELARFAMRVLKPSGWCLAMAGHLYRCQILTQMIDAGLLELGRIVISFPGGHHSRIGMTKMFQSSKDVLLFQKPPRRQPPQWGPDLLAAPKNGRDKTLHRWQQSQEIFEKLVERFTAPGALVADPFAGSGTTLRAACALGRSAWGADIEAPNVARAAGPGTEETTYTAAEETPHG